MQDVRTVAILQARLASTRLPGKVLADIAGAPMLVRVLERLRACALDQIVVASPYHDTAIGDAVRACGIGEWYGYHGPADDVLGRYVAAAKAYRADLVVRVTSDCPLLDPATVDRVVRVAKIARHADYTSNVIRRTFPDGLDTEALWRDTLDRLDRHAKHPTDREHVTRYLLRALAANSLFVGQTVLSAPNRSTWRWTVDTPDDLDHVRDVYRAYGLADQIVPYPLLAAKIAAAREAAA